MATTPTTRPCGHRQPALLHWSWRHAWGLYETHPSRLTRGLFNLLDRWMDVLA